MGSNIRDFALGLDRFEAEIPKRIQAVHRAVALEAVKGLVQMTPVDTGRARANWQVTQDTPASAEVDRLDRAGQQTIAEGSARALEAEAYSVTYITNNLLYIESLEGGSSTQAPAGMLNVTFARLQSWLKRQR